MKLQTLFGIVLGMLVSISVCADPLNVLVGDLTFTRPSGWKLLEADPNSPAVCRFIITGMGKDAEARFYRAGPEPEGAARMWRKYLPKDEADKMRRETKAVGKTTITYVFLKGTLTLPGQRPSNNQGFVGVVVPYGTKFVHIRFSGPEDIVEGAVDDLKKMVEAAVKERDEETSEK